MGGEEGIRRRRTTTTQSKRERDRKEKGGWVGVLFFVSFGLGAKAGKIMMSVDSERETGAGGAPNEAGSKQEGETPFFLCGVCNGGGAAFSV